MRFQTFSRFVLVLALVALHSACFRWGSEDFQFDESVSVQIVPTASAAAPNPTTNLQPTRRAGLPPTVEIEPPRVGQGGTAIVRLRGENLQGITASLEGKALPLVQIAGVAVAMVGITPDHELGDFAVVVRGGGEQDVIAVLTVVRTPWPVENITVTGETADLLTADAAQRELAIRGPILQTFTNEPLWSGPFLRPSQAPLSDQFGVARSYNDGPVSSYHSGVDFGAEAGDPIVAAARGRVVFAGPLPVRGNSVIIDHGLGVLTGYHHMSEISAAEGQLVNAGDRVGRVGATGLSTGPHLHWEVIVRGVNVDGLPWTQRAFAP